MAYIVAGAVLAFGGMWTAHLGWYADAWVYFLGASICLWWDTFTRWRRTGK